MSDIILLDFNPDARGFSVELFRDDWSKMKGIKQVFLSVSKPGVIRAWHCHLRGQTDYLTAIVGKVLTVYYDPLKQIFREFILEQPVGKLVKLPAATWHGIKNIGTTDACVIYFMDKLYDHDNPDEERFSLDHSFPGAGVYFWKDK